MGRENSDPNGIGIYPFIQVFLWFNIFSGVMLTIRNAMTRRYGLSDEEAGAKFFILDENGLITKARKNLLELEENFYSLTTFAEDDTSMEGMSLIDVVKSVKPSVLIGLSGCGGIFTDEVLTEVGKGCPVSNHGYFRLFYCYNMGSVVGPVIQATGCPETGTAHSNQIH